MGAHRDKVVKLSPDPGVLYLAGVADEMAAQLLILRQRLDSCCGSDIAAPAPLIAKPASKPESPTE